MYYELFAIARITDPLHVTKEATKIASTVGKLILNNRGVIRDITSLGARPLPKIVSREQERHFQGYNFIIGFDSSSNVQAQLLRTLRKDPRILRASMKKHDLTKSLNPGTSLEQALR
ncbi:mitochondrial 37S ribosomal protein bS6m [Lodderomyces beijingensis]|uniref:Ribosomal protein S6 n=1 Tax=Lodderomyces beijingensis TaxID=1775926 RepID=A0ABP0ZFM1_9ASCO